MLDASAIIALARNERDAAKIVGDALEYDKCYVTPPTIATIFYILFESDGEAFADHWLDYITGGAIVTVEPCLDRDFLKAVAIARTIARLPLCSRYAAALAGRKDIPVITLEANFEDLSQAGFCKVRWLR